MTIKKDSIQTPAILLDLDTLERNIEIYHQMATAGNKKLWPMIKTHKSTEIARMQLEYGATGFLCGTLDECEAIYENIVHSEKRYAGIMYAYPVASYPNISRVVRLAKVCNAFYLRIDGHEQAVMLNQAAKEAGVCINYTVTINSGLDRFGIVPYELEGLMGKLTSLKHMKFCGISTHPGHVYSEADYAGVVKVATQESEIMLIATKSLSNMGIAPQIIGTGSTPTYPLITNDALINCLHPGNYVFMDNMQVSLGCAKEEDCALTVLATVISAPRTGEYIIDAGSKCLGLDKGAHGNGKIKGHGQVKGLDINISTLSEEVGKITAPHQTLKIGDKLEIIPNHACATANNTSFYMAMRKGNIERIILVDMRGNSKCFPSVDYFNQNQL